MAKSSLPVWASAEDIERLRRSLEESAAASDRASGTLIRLTWVLVVLTAVIAALTVVLLVR